MNIWRIDYLDNDITFIDLIKGFIPSNFSKLISNRVKNKTKTFENLRTFLYKKTMEEYWKERCNKQYLLEKQTNIKKIDKKDSISRYIVKFWCQAIRSLLLTIFYSIFSKPGNQKNKITTIHRHNIFLALQLSLVHEQNQISIFLSELWL